MAGIEPQLPLFGRVSPAEEALMLPAPSVAENLHADYARTGLSLGPHPLKLIRSRLHAARFTDSRAASRSACPGYTTRSSMPHFGHTGLPEVRPQALWLIRQLVMGVL